MMDEPGGSPVEAMTDTTTNDPNATQPAVARALTVTPSAAARIAELIAAEGQSGLTLRVFVSGGGCSGFQYGFSFDNTRNEDDHVFAGDGVSVVIDDTSLDLLAGSEVNWVETLGAASFQIRNPNAASSCGCGASFSV